MRLHTIALTVFGIAFAQVASAAVVVLNFDTIVTGDTPSGSNLATLTISDLGSDSVLVNLSHNSTSITGQFITGLWLNVNPFTSMTQDDRTPANKFDGLLGQGLDSQQNAGLNFDLSQAFETSSSSGGANRLKKGESVSFKLSGSGLNATDFLSTATPTGGQRTDVLAMIHLQGIPGGGSVKLGAVPEPATMIALGAGVCAILRRRRSRS